MREQYIELRQNVFNSQKEGKPVSINLSFFYSYYVSKYESLPKERTLPKKDRFGNMFIDEHGNIVFETIESRMISLGEFQQTFGMALQFYLDNILEYLDKIFMCMLK